DYPLAPARGAVMAAAALEAPALTFSLGGLSKGSGLPHMKVGWIVAHGPDADITEAMSGLELVLDTYLSVSTPAQRALPRLLSLGAEIRGRIAARVRANHTALVAAIAPESP